LRSLEFSWLERNIEGNCFATMLAVTFYSYGVSIFAYEDDFTDVSSLLMKNAMYRNIHSISNLKF
jgi:hypothetical protein